jgi:hypothetical protein
MVSPVYAFQNWLAGVMHTTSEAAVLGTLFFLMLVVEPVALLGLAALATRMWTASGERLLPVVMRYAYALIPLGLGVWVAHYSFHLLTGFWTFVPVVQSTLIDLGVPLLGEPLWRLSGMSPGLVYPLELGFLSLGLLGSLLAAYRISERDYKTRPWQAFIPWAALCVLLFSAAIWLLNQPMEMRGTFLGG